MVHIHHCIHIVALTWRPTWLEAFVRYLNWNFPRGPTCCERGERGGPHSAQRQPSFGGNVADTELCVVTTHGRVTLLLMITKPGGQPGLAPCGHWHGLGTSDDKDPQVTGNGQGEHRSSTTRPLSGSFPLGLIVTLNSKCVSFQTNPTIRFWENLAFMLPRGPT